MLTLLVVGLIVAAVSMGSGGEAAAPPANIVPTTDPNTSIPADQLTTFEDPETGFSVQYPKSWRRVDAPVRDVRLVLDAGNRDRLDGLTIRVERTEQPTTSDNIHNIEAFARAAVELNSSAKILKHQTTTLNGMPTLYYLYTFRDEATGNEGVHAHYFVFQGRKMNILVFQALPADGFDAMANTFDQIANSFRSKPDPVVPVSPTSVPPAPPTTLAPR